MPKGEMNPVFQPDELEYENTGSKRLAPLPPALPARNERDRVIQASQVEHNIWKRENRYMSDALPALPARNDGFGSEGPRFDSKGYDDDDLKKEKGSRSQRDSLPAPPPPPPDYPQKHQDQKRASGRYGDDNRDNWKFDGARECFGNIRDFVTGKERSKAKTVIAILVVSAILVILGVAIFITVLYTGQKGDIKTATDPTNGVTESMASIVIVGVELDATVRLSNRAFIPQYNNDLSPQYKDLADNFTNMMDGVFYNSDLSGVYNGTEVNGFSPGSVIVLFKIRLLAPPTLPTLPPGVSPTPGGTIEDQIKMVEAVVQVAVTEVIEQAIDDGSLDDLGVDSTSLMVTDVGVDVEIVTLPPPTVSTSPPPTVSSTPNPDQTPPAITCPENIVMYTEGEDETANITWTVPDATDDSGHVTVDVNMAPGLWPNGFYHVIVTASDSAGNTAACSFNVTIKSWQCDAGWTLRGQMCYRFPSYSTGPYYSAVGECGSLGATPYVPSSKKEFEKVADFIAVDPPTYVWVGCDDVIRDQERLFYCFDGTEILVTSPWWAPGQPNGEVCLVYDVHDRDLHDWHCSFEAPVALCEKRAT